MTWLDLPPGTGFSVHNLPFGIFSRTADGLAQPEGPPPHPRGPPPPPR
jgi:hypothetical protein